MDMGGMKIDVGQCCRNAKTPFFYDKSKTAFLTKKHLGNSRNYTEMPAGNDYIKRRCVIFATKSSAASYQA